MAFPGVEQFGRVHANSSCTVLVSLVPECTGDMSFALTQFVLVCFLSLHLL